MNSCVSLSTGLCGRRIVPRLFRLLGTRGTFPASSPAIEYDARKDFISANTRQDAVSFPQTGSFARLWAQTPQQTYCKEWQLEGRMFYSKEVHDHFFSPRNAGAFDMSDPETRKKVGTAVVGKAACGDVIKLQVMVEDGKIKDARFKTFGCGSAIASSSYATEIIKGKSCEDALRLKNTDIAEYLSLPPVKVHCSLLAEDAVRHAIKDYQKKQAMSQKSDAAAAPPTHQDFGRSSTSPSASPPSVSMSASADATISSPASAAFGTVNKESTSTAAAAEP